MCSIGHPDRHGPITLGHQHGPRWWPRPQASAGSPVTIEATDINTSAFQLLQDPGSRPGPCHSPVPDISWDLGGQVPAIQVSLLFTTFNFPDSSLSPFHKAFLLSRFFTFLPCSFSPLWCQPPSARALGLLFGSQGCLVEYCLPQPWRMARLCSLSLAQARPTDSGLVGTVAPAWAWPPQTPKLKVRGQCSQLCPLLIHPEYSYQKAKKSSKTNKDANFRS